MNKFTEEDEIQKLGKKTKMGYLIEISTFPNTANDLKKVNLCPCVYKDNPVLGIHNKEICFLSNLYRFKNNLTEVVKIEKKFPMEIGYIVFLDFNYASVYSPNIPGYGHKLICNLYFNGFEDQMSRVKKNLLSFYFPRYDARGVDYVNWRNALTRYINIYGLDQKEFESD